MSQQRERSEPLQPIGASEINAPTDVSPQEVAPAVQPPPRTPEGNDAVCFTAGLKAAVIGSGTIHAYLAARRPPPRVVAGISLGALNAAAMQRVYREMAEAAGKPPEVQEAARWAWFRQYLDTLSAKPFDVLWKAIPDQSDFFADMIPIRDTSVPPGFENPETSARRDLYLKVKLGRWLAHLPVSGRLLASAVVNYVRMRERYPLPQRIFSRIRLLANVSWFIFLVTVRVCISPQFFPEHRFRLARTKPASGVVKKGRFRIPGIGWLNLFSVTLSLLLLLPVIVLIIVMYPPASLGDASYWVSALLLVGLAGLITLTARFRQKMMPWRIVQKLLLPLLGLAAYAYSLINALCVGSLLVISTWGLYASLTRDPITDLTSAAFGVAALWWSTTLLFVPAIVLRETRHWLVDAGLLEQWPRPLFGWGPFLGLWVNLSSLVTSLALGGHFIWMARHYDGFFHAGVFAVATPLLLVAVPVLPLIPLVAPVLLWRHMRRFASATMGWRKWVAWGLSVVTSVGLLGLATVFFAGLVDRFNDLLGIHGLSPSATAPNRWNLFVLAAFVVMLTWFVFVTLVTQPVPRRWFTEWLLEKVGLRRSLIPDLHLRLTLLHLFDPGAAQGEPQNVDGGPGYPPAVVVAAPLQTLYEKGKPRVADQLWAKPGTPLLHALRCALSVPPLFIPVRVRKPEELAWWLRDSTRGEEKNQNQLKRGIDLVDGSVIRQNPLPAAFGFLRGTQAAEDMAAHNDREHPAIHVVYGVPIEGRPGADGDTFGGIQNTIVDVGLGSLRLSQRRDTQLEVIQTNVIARLEQQITPRLTREEVTHAIFADEIAPEQDVIFSNNLSPTRDEILDGVAAGCRRTVERLYGHDLGRFHGPAPAGGCVSCSDFFLSIGRLTSARPTTPGLPEVCGRCTGVLRAPAAAQPPSSSTASVETFLSEPKVLCAEHPQLSGERPRIVFIASGGVFRGAFQIGVLAALRVSDVKPDLIVGASVGTLMGGALGAMSCRPDSGTLAQLVDVFLNVDERVALTPTLKNAARELGIRGRSVHLSPRQVRSMVRRGGRKDPGFAATGAPSALTDAISDLFLIPHRKTQKIAADFVAGDVTGAAQKLITQLRTETIRRLEIEKAVLGASLLERVAADLLSDGTGEGRLNRQPFQAKEIAFYGTTTNLRTQSAMLLGGNGLYPNAPYDFVEAALASSAFPAVFAPRAESLVFPGTGRADVLFADGGMFDNLPFLPAIEILSRAQRGHREIGAAHRTALDLVQQRLKQPDLLIAGALDPRPETDEETRGSYDSIEAVRRRAGSLQHNVKIRSFELAAQRIYSQLLRLETAQPDWIHTTTPHFVDGIVNAGVMAVFPASREHLNGTFSFCASTGLSHARVQKSIADGCYQTLLGFSRHQIEADAASGKDLERQPEMLTTRSVSALTAAGRIGKLRISWDPLLDHNMCPYFERGGQRFECPFASKAPTNDRRIRRMRGVFAECKADSSHRPAIEGPSRAVDANLTIPGAMLQRLSGATRHPLRDRTSDLGELPGRNTVGLWTTIRTTITQLTVRTPETPKPLRTSARNGRCMQLRSSSWCLWLR